ncbi:hypothetical protein D3C80_731080 [compost metagenome]
MLDRSAHGVHTGGGLLGQAIGARVHFGHGVFDLAQGGGHAFQGAFQPLNDLLAGQVDHVGGLIDDLARAVDAGLGGFIGLLGGVEQGFAQAVGADLGLFDGGGGGGALFLGGGLQGRQGATGLLDQQIAGLGGQGLEAIQRQLGGVVETVGLALRQVHQGAELIGHGLDLGLQGVADVAAGLVELAGGAAGQGQLLGELGALALDLGREVFLIGAQGVGGGDQRGALLAQAFLDRLDLFGDARAGGFQTQGLAGQVVGGGAGGVLGLAGGGGQIGGAGGQSGFGLAQLGLGQVGGVHHHPRLALDGVDDAGGLTVQLHAEGAHLLALAAQLIGQATGGAARALGGFIQTNGFLGQGLAQQGHVVAGALGGQGGLIDVAAQAGQHLSSLVRRQGGRADQGFGHVAGAAGFLRQAGALTHGVRQHDGQTGRGQGDQGVNGQTQRLQLDRARSELIGEPGGDAADPQGRGQTGDQIGVAAGFQRGCAARSKGSRRRGVLDHGGGRVGGHGQGRQVGRVFGLEQGGGALIGQALFFQQATAAALGHRLFRRGRQRKFSVEFDGRLVQAFVVRADDGGGLLETFARFRVGQVERRPMAGLHGASISFTIRRIRGEGARRLDPNGLIRSRKGWRRGISWEGRG